MSPVNIIPVSEDLYREVAQRAQQNGLSTQDWISSVLEARVRMERETEEFFKKRAAGAGPLSLGQSLNKAPDRPPDPRRRT
jgi:hypothetical protein